MALLKGRVVNARGQPVPHAVVHFVAAPGPRPDIAQVADEEGRFVLALQPGAYVIGARSDSAGSGQSAFHVHDDQETSIEIVVTV